VFCYRKRKKLSRLVKPETEATFRLLPETKKNRTTKPETEKQIRVMKPEMETLFYCLLIPGSGIGHFTIPVWS